MLPGLLVCGAAHGFESPTRSDEPATHAQAPSYARWKALSDLPVVGSSDSRQFFPLSCGEVAPTLTVCRSWLIRDYLPLRGRDGIYASDLIPQGGHRQPYLHGPFVLGYPFRAERFQQLLYTQLLQEARRFI